MTTTPPLSTRTGRSRTADNPGRRVLRGSRRAGLLLPNPEVGRTRPLYVNVPPDHPDGLSVNYEVGDVVVFHSLTVHASGANRTDSLRMSADFRFQRCDEPIRPETARPCGWPTGGDRPELTRDWN